MQTMAKILVLNYVNNRRADNEPLKLTDVYIVWFCKSLNTWKALLGTNIPDGMYYEVTHDSEKKKTYFDAYKRWEQVIVDDTE